VVAALLLAGNGPAWAQTGTPPAPHAPVVATPPLNVIVPNYNGVAVGEVGGLEGGAYVARVEDSSATWYNPAGLARAEKSSVSGSAGIVQVAAIRAQGVENGEGTLRHVPAAVGVVVKRLFGRDQWTGGFQITRFGSWNESADIERQVVTAGSTERAAYSASSSFGGWMGSLALGYNAHPRLRLGGSVDLQLTESSSGTYLADQYRTVTGLDSVLVEGRGEASAFHFRLTAGAQYDLSPSFRLAAVIRTPGLGVWSSGSYFQEGSSSVGNTNTTASFFEPSGDVTMRVPLEVSAGAAYIGKRVQLEADLLMHAAAGQYNAFQSARSMTVLSDAGLGNPPAEQQLAFTPVVVDSQTVVNVAVGGVYAVTSNGVVKIHAGFSTDGSPVGAADTRFTKVDMQTWTVGVSGSAKFLMGSVGVRYESGVSDRYDLRALQNGQNLTTAFELKNLAFVYSFAFRF
jgi:hypothetical protein